jgi:hypothetical protein
MTINMPRKYRETYQDDMEILKENEVKLSLFYFKANFSRIA